VVADARVLVPRALEAVRETGELEGLVRDRLALFWRSERARALLD